MHVLAASEFWPTLALAAGAAFLASRGVLRLLRGRGLGLREVPIAHGASFLLCYALLVAWRSGAGEIHWFAGHIAFIPQVILFVLDLLRWRDGEEEGEVGDPS
ncbi:hypothetical protein HMF7854_00305 [Sphingomonas ginkgonis]|uniref:Uncharacterized protein n=1 Tax=Sphingomonas ginkgonis TaxID=2315330 RepID=A0A429V683_9SPHN|nr:hypothetical protein [Sphingomonas ginkgonis]RST29442.1 hypothetical protein HMF7854_00305 [Sphingomonas ginkgonis]